MSVIITIISFPMYAWHPTGNNTIELKLMIFMGLTTVSQVRHFQANPNPIVPKNQLQQLSSWDTP
jgi:hypothetical protein